MSGKANVLSFCIFLLLLIGLACGGTAPTATPPPAISTVELIPAGDSTLSLTFGGEERSYILHVPPGLDASRDTPVVLVFHGFGLDAKEMIRITGFNTQADVSGFFAVYPNGTGRKLSWNGGDCCGEAASKKVDDVGFVRVLIEDLSSHVNVDPKRIYATGFSNGAMMVYRLACELSDLVAAIGPVGATQAVQTCQPKSPVSLVHFHGTNDQLNPYNGGYGPGGGVDFAPVVGTIQSWVHQNGCREQAEVGESGNIVHERYAACEQGSAVELYTILDGEHAWPGGKSVSAEIGAPTSEISATPLMWEFFSYHPMP